MVYWINNGLIPSPQPLSRARARGFNPLVLRTASRKTRVLPSPAFSGIGAGGEGMLFVANPMNQYT